ncbi:MAG: hypothetical protein NXH84_04020 [Rhodobacteraceae bacterium]|nr:hypothetical protein [Paracoccaceae bacterium]
MKRIETALAAIMLACPARAEAPLSAIDWLDDPPPITVAQPLAAPLERQPAVEGSTIPEVTVMPLDAPRRDSAGLLPTATTGLPANLWAASATDTLVSQMERIAPDPLPAIQALYYTLLLAEAEPPADAGPDARFLKARIDALRKLGAVQPARALIEQAGTLSEALFDDWFDLALLDGAETAACNALQDNLDLSGSYANRVYCLARAGDWSTAALTFDGARAVGLLSETEAQLLAQYLDPETIEESPSLAPTGDMTPLLFRLYEAAGMPLPSGNLPREYAVADLRGLSGWKAEIEAAERLVHTGALPANRLLGLYTDQRAAASGGVWDRVAAIQRLETALSDGDTEEIARTLDTLWPAMRRQGLSVAFATLYAEDLARAGLTGTARDTAFEVALLAPAYETLAPDLAGSSDRDRFLTGLTRGEPDPALARTTAERAIAAGFAATGPSRDHAGMLTGGRLGQAILGAALQLDAAGPNQGADITAGIATLRAVGLEETARRAALQILLLRAAG